MGLPSTAQLWRHELAINMVFLVLIDPTVAGDSHALSAGHLFRKVGLQPCSLPNATAPLGTQTTVNFTIYSSLGAQASNTTQRTLVVVSPCALGTGLLFCLQD